MRRRESWVHTLPPPAPAGRKWVRRVLFRDRRSFLAWLFALLFGRPERRTDTWVDVRMFTELADDMRLIRPLSDWQLVPDNARKDVAA